MKKIRSVRRVAYAFVALVLAGVALTPVLQNKAAAYNFPPQRAIKPSTSAVSASATYEISWTAGTSTAIRSIVVDFCDSPIIQNACTPISGFTVGAGTTTNLSATLTGGGASWSSSSANSGRTLTLTNSGTASSMTANTTAVSFELTTVTNPNVLGSYYARILTYANATGADAATGAGSYTATGTPIVGNAVDAGGIAMSTASQITITAKVQERLTFCVYTGANCAAGGTAVTLGDANGVLDTAGPYVDKNTKFDIATNASYNAVVRVKGPTLTSGSNTITAIGATKATTPGSPGTAEQFGFCAYTASGPALTIDAVYNGASGGSPTTECQNTSQSAGTATPGGDNGAYFAFDTNTTDGTGSTYGDLFATKSAGLTSVGTIPFIGNITSTTEAGIYQTTLTFIATGTY